jgi:hypothetical protein
MIQTGENNGVRERDRERETERERERERERKREIRRLFSEAQPLIWFLPRSTVGSVVVFAVEGVEGLLLCSHYDALMMRCARHLPATGPQ